MKIAVLIDAWFPITGGGQVHVARISQILSKKYNCKIEIITSRLDGKLKIKNGKWRQSLSASQRQITTVAKPLSFRAQNLKITKLGPAWSFENFLGRIFFLILATFQLISKNYDLISAHAFLPAIPAKVVKFAKRTPVVLTVHGVSINVWEKLAGKFLAKVFEVIERIILFKFKYDYQITVSSDFLKYPNVNKNIAVIGNGVDLEEFEKVQTKKDKLFKLLFVGRLHPQKGLFYLANAVKNIIKKYPQVYVVLVGEGRLETKLKEYLKRNGIEKHFVFKGRLIGKDLIFEYKSAHLFVLPSVYEGFPLTLLEAWAAKLPVVATSVGEVPNLVKNGVNGILVRPTNTAELAKAIIFVIEDKNRDQFGEEGFKLAKKYNWEGIAKKTYQIFKNAVKNA